MTTVGEIEPVFSFFYLLSLSLNLSPYLDSIPLLPSLQTLARMKTRTKMRIKTTTGRMWRSTWTPTKTTKTAMTSPTRKPLPENRGNS